MVKKNELITINKLLLINYTKLKMYQSPFIHMSAAELNKYYINSSNSSNTSNTSNTGNTGNTSNTSNTSSNK